MCNTSHQVKEDIFYVVRTWREKCLLQK